MISHYKLRKGFSATAMIVLTLEAQSWDMRYLFFKFEAILIIDTE